MKTLWFIRHAESLSNAGFPTETPHAIGLSEKGLGQAVALGLKSKQGQEVKGQPSEARQTAAGSPQGSEANQRVKKAGAKQPWPKPLAERIRATEQALHAAGHAVTAEELTTHFSRAKAADLQEILESLVTLGRARQEGDNFSI